MYSVDVENWWPVAGDTDQTLGAREFLGEAKLTTDQAERMAKVDDAVLRLAAETDGIGWDVAMLKEIAALIRSSRADNRIAA
jgi:hypothetical protein